MWKKIKYWNRQKNYRLRQLRLRLVQLFFDLTCNQTDFDPGNIRKVLILRDDNKIGDMIVSTGLFARLHDAGIRVDVVAGGDNAFIAEAMPQVSKIFLYPGKISKILRTGWELRHQKYDMVLDFGDYLSPAYYSFISLINARHTLGFNKSAYCRYDLNTDSHRTDEHVTVRYKQVLAMFGLASADYKYQLQVPDNARTEILPFIHSLGSHKLVVVNPFAAGKERTMSQQQITDIIDAINDTDPHLQIVVIGPPGPLADIRLADTALKNPGKTFWSAVVLVQHASLVISPDTSWIHVACAYRRPLIALYKNKIIDGGLINSKVWAPNYHPSTQIITDKAGIADITIAEMAGPLKMYLAPSTLPLSRNEEHTDKIA